MSNEKDEFLRLREKPEGILKEGYSITSLVVPKVDTVLDDALSILHMQLKRTGVSLSLSEDALSAEATRNLCSVIDAVSKISREKRQRDEQADADLDLMSDEDMAAELAALEGEEE